MRSGGSISGSRATPTGLSTSPPTPNSTRPRAPIRRSCTLSHSVDLDRPRQPEAKPGDEHGAGSSWSAAMQACVTESTMLRCCCLRVAATVRMRSTKRLPAALWVPQHPLRRRTAGLRARPAALCVGSTSGTSTNVQRAGARASRARPVAAVLACPHPAPRRCRRSPRRRSGRMAVWNCPRVPVPARTRCHQVNIRVVSRRKAWPSRAATLGEGVRRDLVCRDQNVAAGPRRCVRKNRDPCSDWSWWRRTAAASAPRKKSR